MLNAISSMVAETFERCNAARNIHASLPVTARLVCSWSKNIFQMDMHKGGEQLFNRTRWIVAIGGVPPGINGGANGSIASIANFHLHIVGGLLIGMIFNA